MTKIQLRRDTAANWSTNNPTPSAGEPCFEIDTGRQKIGDGITAYNSLPYQGGTSDTAVTTDTKQTISGLKTFVNDINLNQWTTGGSDVRETHIDLSLGNGTEYISASGTDKSFGLYCASDQGIQVGTSKTDFTQGLSVKPNSLTFKSSDGTTTDLLAGGSGDVTTTGNNTFTGTNIFKGKSLCVGDDDNYSNIVKYSGKEYVVGDQEDTRIFNPVMLGSEFGNTVLSHGVKALEYDRTSTADKAYSIMVKSPKNNEHMAHMAMPSDKYIDLDLGASGTTYIAPADGFIHFRRKCTTIGQNIFILVSNLLTLSDKSTADNLNTGVLVPVKKGTSFTCQYSADGEIIYFRFIYAVGSELSS